MSDGIGLDDMQALFAKKELGRPPVPRVLRSALGRLGEWCWATRDDMQPGPMYGFFKYPFEAMLGARRNYVAVSHGGHGVQSYAISYHLVYGRLALFAQTGWGGAYGDARADAEAVRAQLERCARLIETYEMYAAADLLPPAPARLIIVESTLVDQHACGWLAQPVEDEQAAQQWLDAHQTTELATEAAIALLEPSASTQSSATLMSSSCSRPPPPREADLSGFSAAVRPAVADVFDRHAELPRPGIDYPAWLTGCLGDRMQDVWFVAENPSAGAAARAGSDATIEDQWCITPGDMLFRRTLVDCGFKDAPADEPGGWRCYVTDVVKSPYVVGDWNARTNRERRKVATWWAPVLEAEINLGRPLVIVTLGARARDMLAFVERTGLVPNLPQARVAIDHYVYVQSRPQGKVAGGDEARVEDWRQRFAQIAHHPARASRSEDA